MSMLQSERDQVHLLLQQSEQKTQGVDEELHDLNSSLQVRLMTPLMPTYSTNSFIALIHLT